MSKEHLVGPFMSACQSWWYPACTTRGSLFLWAYSTCVAGDHCSYGVSNPHDWGRIIPRGVLSFCYLEWQCKMTEGTSLTLDHSATLTLVMQHEVNFWMSVFSKEQTFPILLISAGFNLNEVNLDICSHIYNLLQYWIKYKLRYKSHIHSLLSYAVTIHFVTIWIGQKRFRRDIDVTHLTYSAWDSALKSAAATSFDILATYH
jgi:hypothetical protein